MGEEYAVVARAVRQPLRRWWRRVGSWWIVLAILLLAAFAAVPLARLRLFGWPGGGSSVPNPFTPPSFYLPPGHPYAPTPYSAPGSYSPWEVVFAWIDAANFLIVPLAALLWLLAAQRARSLLSALTAGAPFAGGGPFSVGVRLRLLVAQAAWPFALIALREMALACRYQLAQTGSAAAVPGILGVALVKAGGSLELLFFLMLLSCVLLADPPPRDLVLLCWLALFWGWVAFMFGQAGLYWPAVRQLPPRDVFEPNLAGLSLMSAGGLALVLLGCYLLWVRRRAGVALLAGLAFLRALSVLKLDYADVVPAAHQTLKSLVGHGQYALFAITAWEPPVWLEYPTYGDLRSVYLHLLAYSFKLEFDPWLWGLVLLGQLALIYAYYQLLSQLLVLGSAHKLAARARPPLPTAEPPQPVQESDHSPEKDPG